MRGTDLANDHVAQGGCPSQLPYELQPCDDVAAIDFRSQIVGLDLRRLCWARPRDVGVSSSSRIDIVDAIWNDD